MNYKNCMENNKKNLYTDISSILFWGGRGGGGGWSEEILAGTFLWVLGAESNCLFGLCSLALDFFWVQF